MAFEAVIDVAEIDDLGFRVATVGTRAIQSGELLRPSRLLIAWATAVAVIAIVGLVGRILEPRPVVAPPPVTLSVSKPPAIRTAVDWPSNGHSAFRYPVGNGTTMTLRFKRVPGSDGSIALLAVHGRIAGPVGNVAVELVRGDTTFDEVTRYYAPIGGRPPAPYGAFDMEFAIPGDVALSDLWIVARAYSRDKVVAVESLPVDPTWPLVGPNKYVIDDAIVITPTGSEPG